MGLRVRERDSGAARLRERDGVSVVHAGQSNRPHGWRRYFVGSGVKERDADFVVLAVVVAEPELERVYVPLAVPLLVDVRLGKRVPGCE